VDFQEKTLRRRRKMDEVENTYSQIYELILKGSRTTVEELNQVKKLLENLYIQGIVKGCENTLQIFRQEREMALCPEVRRQVEQALEEGGELG